MSRGRLVGYLPFQFVDYLVQRAALPLILVFFVAGVPLYGALHGNPAFFTTPEGPQAAKQLFTSVVVLFLPLGAFLGAAGIISTDRQRGYGRFFFSRPVGVVAYYGQTYLLHGAAFVGLFGLITWGYGAMTIHQPVVPAMEAAGLTFVLVGGLGLLLGALTRFDGALLALIYVVAMTLQQVAAASGHQQLPGWAVRLSQLLPPAFALDQLRVQLYSAHPLDVAQLWHVLGYGLGAFILGLVALRNLPLSR